MLAREVTTLVHGADQVARAEQASSVLFGEDIATLGADDVLAVFEDVPSTELPRRDVRRQGDRRGRSGRARAAGAVEERGAAARAVGRRLREQPARPDPQARMTRDQAIDGRLFVLRKGQKQNHLVRLT